MIVEIPFETPSKKNSRITDTRTGRSFPSKKFREWHRNASIWLKSNFRLECFDDRPVRIDLCFTHGTNKRSDSDNKDTVKEVADKIGFHKDTVYEWIYSRGMPFHRAGRRCRITVDWDEFMSWWTERIDV